jgi:signal transduction histidine kinase
MVDRWRRQSVRLFSNPGEIECFADKPTVANRIDAGQLRARILKDMAHWLRYPWGMYVVFCAIFAIQTDFGAAHRMASWTFLCLMTATGAFRMWCGRRVEACGDTGMEPARRTFLASISIHSLIWGAFVAYALWAESGNQALEMSLIVGVAGFGTGGAVVLAAYPLLAWLHLGIQCGAVLIWSLSAQNILIFTLVVSFVVFVGATIQSFNAHILGMFGAQMLLEIRGKELTRAKELAEEASSARAQFLANMSHEIRTPLHGVLGLTQILGETSLNEVQKELLNTLNRSGTHLLAIVDDILNWSKISSGRLAVESVPFDVEALLADVAAPAKAMAHAKGLRWTFDRPAALAPSYRGDPVRLRQVLANLLSNAVKFTGAGEVRLRVEPGGPGRIAFVVADTGIGISESQAGTLFRDFTQADASTTRRFGGTGLGLAISKRPVELMGGSLTWRAGPARAPLSRSRCRWRRERNGSARPSRRQCSAHHFPRPRASAFWLRRTIP